MNAMVRWVEIYRKLTPKQQAILRKLATNLEQLQRESATSEWYKVLPELDSFVRFAFVISLAVNSQLEKAER